MPAKRFTDAEVDEIVRMYTTQNPDGTWTGCTLIGRRYGVAAETIANYLHRRGVVMRTTKEAQSGGKRCKPLTSNPVGQPPQCKCGCGELVAWNRPKNRWLLYARGHYRPQRPSADELRAWYWDEGLSTLQIAARCGVSETTPGIWLRRHGIPRRTASAAHIGRQTGAENPAWKGGVTPERQRFYKSRVWSALCLAVFRRDDFRCQRCRLRREAGQPLPLHVHHVATWAEYPDLRGEPDNLVTLCGDCHRWVHSRENLWRDFLVRLAA